MSENIEVSEVKIKNPKRVSAGKKGAEAKKIKAELKREEMEAMKKENNQLKEQINITKDDHEIKEIKEIKYKNYIPLCFIGVVGLGIYMYNFKQDKQANQVAPMTQREKKEIDPFEFN